MSIIVRDPFAFQYSASLILPFVLLPFVLLPFVLRYIYISICRYHFCRKHGCQEAQEKEPVKDPIIGFDFLYESLFGRPIERYLAFLHNLYQDLGNTWESKRWTWVTTYTRDARNVKHVLATGFDDFKIPDLRGSAFNGLLGNGIFTLNGHSWSVTRKILKGALVNGESRTTIKHLEGYFQAFLRRIAEVEEKDEDGATAVTDLQPLFFWLSMDFATRIFMRSSTNMLSSDSSSNHDRDVQFIQDYTTCSTEILKRMRLGPLRYFSFNSVASQAKERMSRYIDDFIDEALRQDQGKDKHKHKQQKEEDIEKGSGVTRREEEEDENDLLSQLTALEMDREQLRGHVLHLLVASRDTTACLLSNLFFELSRKPDVWAKLREEVLSVVGTEPATAEDLNQMQYLKWCVRESLRIHPIIPSNTRQAVRDAILPYGGGRDGNAPLLVRKGTIVIYTVYSMHRDQSVFGPNVEEFVPERWDGLRPGWSYLPFNGGPRVCIGQKLALLETHYIVSRMAQVFEKIEALDSTKSWAELFALAVTCRNGVHVRLTR